MCKGSTYAHHQTDAQTGETFAIGRSRHGFGVLHPHTKSPQDVVACVKSGTVMTFSNIPPAVQGDLRLDSDDIVVTFVERGDDIGDLIRVPDGREFPFSAFANHGINALIGVKKPEDTAESTSNQEDRLVDA